jgi:hypothetical protein
MSSNLKFPLFPSWSAEAVKGSVVHYTKSQMIGHTILIFDPSLALSLGVGGKKYENMIFHAHCVLFVFITD